MPKSSGLARVVVEDHSLAPSARERLPLFDSLRGFAMILMVVFHFCFDLNYFHVIRQGFDYDLFWVLFRDVIMCLFLGLVGVGFYLGQISYRQKNYWRRLIKIALCAAVISGITYFRFPQSWIFFGVLHFVAVATLLGPVVRRFPVVGLPVALAIIALPKFYSSLWFYQSGWNVTGLGFWPPITEDFSPIFPWLGVVMTGVFVGWASRKWGLSVARRDIPFLTWLGHYSLPFYMLHQVVLFPLVHLLSRMV